jgi:uncharacterized membrane protein YeaQ/YmgE (transglycosylase-associated protein family)
MGFLIAVAVGSVLGWIAAILIRRDRTHGILPWALLGVFGALLGAFILGPAFGGGNLLESVLDLRTLYVSAIGSLAVLAGTIAVRARRRRKKLAAQAPPDPFKI